MLLHATAQISVVVVVVGIVAVALFCVLLRHSSIFFFYLIDCCNPPSTIAKKHRQKGENIVNIFSHDKKLKKGSLSQCKKNAK